jgi:hypothetical protein
MDVLTNEPVSVHGKGPPRAGGGGAVRRGGGKEGGGGVVRRAGGGVEEGGAHMALSELPVTACEGVLLQTLAFTFKAFL